MNKTKNIYRRITESLPQRLLKNALSRKNIKYILTNYSLLFLSVSFILFSILAVLSYLAVVETREARHEVLDSFHYWREVSEEHANSPDAFYEAGFYAAELGYKARAKEFLDEAIRLDPSFEKAKKLSQQLIVSSE